MTRLNATTSEATARNSRKRFRQLAARLKQQFPEIVRLDEPLAGYTNYRVGGPADALVRPRTLDQLQAIVRFCHAHQVPLFVLGKGANILVSDQGVPGVVVTLEGCCRQLRREGNHLYAGAGLLVSELVRYCEEHGLGGLDFMSGIPGTVGGALTMNAGAFVGEIGDRVVWVDAFTEAGERIRLSRDQAGFGYRRADGLKNKILLGCWLALEPADSNQLMQARMNYLKRRAEKQPLEYPSCGSVFKRPKGDFAGRLIELV
ncbi:MAG: FAD-binding protein, partial [Calditrichaeota bacterium]